MSVVFPSSPNVGETITDAVTGAVWQFDGEKWTHTPSVPSEGVTMTGPLVLAGDPVGPLDAATKQFVENEVAEVSGAVREVPVAFPFAGNPEAGELVTAPIAMPVTIAANLAGSIGYATTAPDAAATFILIKISSGGTTELGAITFAAGSHSATFSGAGGSLAVGDVMQLEAPDPQDADLADCGVTIMTLRA